MEHTDFNPSSYCSISSAANAFHWAWEKTVQWWAFFVYCSEIKVLVKRKNDSPVNHLSFWLYEGMKNKAFLHVWFSKVLLLEINFSMKQRKKTTSKKTSWTTKQSQQKKNKMLASSLPFFQNTSKNNRSPAIAFVFETSNPEVVSCTNEKVFFSLYSQKTKLPTDKLFFFVNKTIL